MFIVFSIPQMVNSTIRGGCVWVEASTHLPLPSGRHPPSPRPPPLQAPALAVVKPILKQSTFGLPPPRQLRLFAENWRFYIPHRTPAADNNLEHRSCYVYWNLILNILGQISKIHLCWQRQSGKECAELRRKSSDAQNALQFFRWSWCIETGHI